MSSTFFGLNIALQGLYASRTGLDVTNHNISNSGTKGYSRQVIQQKATTPISLNTGKGMIGTGTEVYGIKQMRDIYLDKKYRTESATLGEYTTKTSTSSQVEAIFDSVSETSFSKILDTFYDSIQNLSTNPGSDAYRAVVKQNAISYTQYFNSASEKLQSTQQDLNFNVKATVDQINSFGEQIQNLNRQIYKSEIDGSAANDLRDQRNAIVDELSQLVNVETTEDTEGRFRVSMNGQVLVDHVNATTLEVKQRTLLKSTDFAADTTLSAKYAGSYTAYEADYAVYRQTNTENLYDIYWEGTGVQLDTTDINLSGKLKGYLDMRDGNNNTASAGAVAAVGATGLDEATNYKGVPYYIDKINEFAQTFAKLMNEGIAYDNLTQLTTGGGFADGTNLNGTTNIGLFSTKDPDGTYNTGVLVPADYSKITAANFSIAKEINEDVKNLATTFGSSADKEANDLLKAIIGLKHNNDAFSQGEIVDYMTALTSELAINTSQAKSFEKNQENITLSISNQKLSVSGVNANEEMANMIKYQQIYGAAARMITTMDEIYNTTINKLGTT